MLKSARVPATWASPPALVVDVCLLQTADRLEDGDDADQADRDADQDLDQREAERATARR